MGSAPHQPGPLQLPIATSSLSTSETVWTGHIPKVPGIKQTHIICQAKAGTTRTPVLVLGVFKRSRRLDCMWRAMVCPCPWLSMFHLCCCLPLNDYWRAWIFLTYFSFHSAWKPGESSPMSRRLQPGHIKGSCSSHGNKDVLNPSRRGSTVQTPWDATTQTLWADPVVLLNQVTQLPGVPKQK